MHPIPTTATADGGDETDEREARDDDECGRFLEVNMLSHGDDDDSAG